MTIQRSNLISRILTVVHGSEVAKLVLRHSQHLQPPPGLVDSRREHHHQMGCSFKLVHAYEVEAACKVTTGESSGSWPSSTPSPLHHTTYIPRRRGDRAGWICAWAASPRGACPSS